MAGRLVYTGLLSFIAILYACACQIHSKHLRARLIVLAATLANARAITLHMGDINVSINVLSLHPFKCTVTHSPSLHRNANILHVNQLMTSESFNPWCHLPLQPTSLQQEATHAWYVHTRDLRSLEPPSGVGEATTQRREARVTRARGVKRIVRRGLGCEAVEDTLSLMGSLYLPTLHSPRLFWVSIRMAHGARDLRIY
jgi:hypothetical protein